MIDANAAPINSTLLLIWPEFNGYDLEAIQLLRPHEIFLLYEEGGAAGSSALHEWLRAMDGYTMHDLREWTRDMGMFYGYINHRLIYLQRQWQ
jgi:hypothetical protein